MFKVLILYAPKPSVLSFLPELRNILSKQQIVYHCYPLEAHSEFFAQQKREIRDNLKGVDFVICLGGDGTVLATSSIIHELDIPILPVNFGQLGFIAEETHARNLEKILEEIRDHSIFRENRILLEASKDLSDSKSFSTALNEVYVGSNNQHQVGNFSISIDGQKLSQYKADGVLISTATGSTAYNLSAGGPILYPSLDAFVLNSVVPHRITHRPMVLPSSVTVVLSITNEYSQNIIIDGQYKGQLQYGEKLYVRKSPYNLALLYSSERNYFESLKKKLNWMA